MSALNNKESSAASLSVSGENHIKVKGVLNFDTVPALAKQAEKLFSGMENIRVNFSDVEESNSAGLALLLDMVRTMKLTNKSINFEELPEQILIVARAYGIDSDLNTTLNP